uniref:Major facilitator superfamily (MFS) profile domain-containing protein n=1 Tax=Glossina palpalis gambiensis TaxID=67801 RepID=A0A1B0BWP5_9MUSC
MDVVLQQCVLQLICGMTAALSLNYGIFVIIMEIIGPRYREAMSILCQIHSFSGYALLPLFSYYLRDWHPFYLAILSISFLYLMYACFIYESPRWLFTTGRLKRAISVVKTIAKRNGRPAKDLEQILPKLQAAYEQFISSDTNKTGTIVCLRLNTIVMVYQWLNACMVLYEAAEYISNSGGNILINLGRPLSLILSNLVSAICFLVINCITVFNNVIVVTFAIIGLFGATLTFPNLYLYAGEIFPTVVETTGEDLCSSVGRIGSMIAPFVTIYGVILLTFLLPETRGRSVPET